MKVVYLPASFPAMVLISFEVKCIGDLYDPILNMRTRIWEIPEEQVGRLSSICEEMEIPFRVTERWAE